MRGKVHFAFRVDKVNRKGSIAMKIFGQVCNQEKCGDRSFQSPACYPEEIHRVSCHTVQSSYVRILMNCGIALINSLFRFHLCC